MSAVTEFSETLIAMPVAGLVALVVLAAFALAAFAIYAVAKMRPR